MILKSNLYYLILMDFYHPIPKFFQKIDRAKREKEGKRKQSKAQKGKRAKG
jgi:hypothetical protein